MEVLRVVLGSLIGATILISFQFWWYWRKNRKEKKTFTKNVPFGICGFETEEGTCLAPVYHTYPHRFGRRIIDPNEMQCAVSSGGHICAVRGKKHLGDHICCCEFRW